MNSDDVSSSKATGRPPPPDNANAFLEPGMIVRHPGQPDWGHGQIQSNIDGKLTVNFSEQGKVVLNGHRIVLDLVKG